MKIVKYAFYLPKYPKTNILIILPSLETFFKFITHYGHGLKQLASWRSLTMMLQIHQPSTSVVLSNET